MGAVDKAEKTASQNDRIQYIDQIASIINFSSITSIFHLRLSGSKNKNINKNNCTTRQLEDKEEDEKRRCHSSEYTVIYKNFNCNTMRLPFFVT